MTTDAQVLKGHLDMLLLATLERGPLHGYAVMETLRRSGGSRLDLPTGTIYPALRRLESAGLLDGHWSVVSGRSRRTYTLTAAGRHRLNNDRQAWRDFASIVTRILKPAPS